MNNYPRLNRNSTIKFGGWDPEALQDYNKMNLYKTRSTSSWGIEGHSFTFQDYEVNADRDFLIDPQYPFVYIPKVDWKRFRTKLGPNVASQQHNWIKFTQRCENMPSSKYDVKFNLPGGRSITLYGKDLLVSGKQIGTGIDNCYLGIFMSESPDQKTWFVGGSFFKDNYVVYDMSTLDKGKDYIQVGIGPKNP